MKPFTPILFSALLAAGSFVMRTGSAKGVDAQSTETARKTVIQLVARIQKADYEGDRSSLGRLSAQLAPFEGGKELAPRVRYWRGFAMWRRTLNGFNDSVDPKELEQDLKEALDEFGKVTATEPGFGDARLGMVSCLGSLIYIHQKDVPRVEELARQIGPLAKEAKMVAPDNPRLFWVAGPNIFITPPERGGGQDKAIEMYERGLAAARKHKGEVSDPLEPSWGEPELLMSLAWSHLNRSKPDLKAAEQNARAALEIVPYWHYVRDILIPQIHDAAAKKANTLSSTEIPKRTKKTNLAESDLAVIAAGDLLTVASACYPIRLCSDPWFGRDSAYHFCNLVSCVRQRREMCNAC